LTPQPEPAPAPALSSVAQAQAMGFDAETIADLLAQGLLQADAPWRPTTLDDLNFLAARSAQYDAEEERLTTQYERRLKRLSQRRKWLALYAEDAAAVLEAHLPRTKSGAYAAKSLDLDDGRVCLRTKGGGYQVNEGQYLENVKQIWESPVVSEHDRVLFQAVRVMKRDVLWGPSAVSKMVNEPDEWQVEVLKQPILAYLKEHPDAMLPGVSEIPTREEFVIEKRKPKKEPIDANV
jgi:hypothetical protein